MYLMNDSGANAQCAIGAACHVIETTLEASPKRMESHTAVLYLVRSMENIYESSNMFMKK